MTDQMIEPQPVIDLVEQYVYSELADAERYDNRSPLDSSGVWSLHRLAREVYALGVWDGAQQEGARARGQRARDFDAREAAK